MLRRGVRLLAVIAGWLCVVACAGVLSLWVTGKVVSDRQHALQVLAWLPSWLVLAPAAVLALLTLLVRWPSAVRRGEDEHESTPRRRRGFAWWVSSLMLWSVLGALVWSHWVEMRWLNALKAETTLADGRVKGSLRIAHWNIDAFLARQWSGDLREFFPYPAPDVLLMSSNQPRAAQASCLSSLRKAYDVKRFGNFVVASAVPILHARAYSLNLNQPATANESDRKAEAALRARLEQWWNDNCERVGMARRGFQEAESGDLIVIRLDTRERFGREMVVYYIDMPSDPFASRYRLAERAQQLIEGLRAKRDAEGRAVVPTADMIVGDFNTPRGSASLDLLTNGMENAFDQGGWGLVATFPRPWGLLHIDQMYVAGWLRAARYAVEMPPVGEHWMQWADVVKR
ncbi:MAG: hypothetical protein IBJ18_05190 [Phycisphaerales bacterium]|nr:hypothetical protein [Phycisphaerales bacterium]